MPGGCGVTTSGVSALLSFRGSRGIEGATFELIKPGLFALNSAASLSAFLILLYRPRPGCGFTGSKSDSILCPSLPVMGSKLIECLEGMIRSGSDGVVCGGGDSISDKSSFVAIRY